MSHDESVKRVEANGIWLAYEECGNPTDPVILLIMGLGQQMIGWPDEFVALLVQSHFRVVRFDNRDMGQSTWIDNKPAVSAAEFLEVRQSGAALEVPYTLTDMADDALGLMDALGIHQAHVVGASMGGMIGQVMAAKAPERVRTLISIMSSSGDHKLPGPSPEVQARLFVGPAKDATPEQRLEYAAETLRMIAYPDPERPPEAFRTLGGTRSQAWCESRGVRPPAAGNRRRRQSRAALVHDQVANTGNTRCCRPADPAGLRRPYGGSHSRCSAGDYRSDGARSTAVADAQNGKGYR